jgi:hypothetical protein
MARTQPGVKVWGVYRTNGATDSITLWMKLCIVSGGDSGTVRAKLCTLSGYDSGTVVAGHRSPTVRSFRS